MLGDAERLRWFLLPSEADVFLRRETHDGYPRVPSFTPLRRCYHGEMKVSGEDSEHDRKEDQVSTTGCKGEVEMCEEIKEKLETDKCTEARDNDICDPEENKEVSLENEVVTKCSTENCSGIKRTEGLKFHNPPRHVFNLVVKVC